MLCQLFPTKLMTSGNKITLKDATEEVEDWPETVELSHNEASMYLRLTYALTYASIQGRTIRNKNICLLDTHRRRYFTTRHLIVGVSRATHGCYVHIPTETQEKAVLQKAAGNVSEHFLADIESQEHMAIPEPEEAVEASTSVAAGSSDFVLTSLITPVIAPVERDFFAGSRRLKCEPCFNILKTDEQFCIFCKKSREEIIAAQA